VNQFAAQLRETLRRPERVLKLLDGEARREFFARRRLESLVCAAWAKGQSFDLSGVGYGRHHAGNTNEISAKPRIYYPFLAGLAAHIGATAAIEIGTHWGGSAVAIARGMLSRHPAPRLATIDVSTESENYLPLQAEARFISKIVGDANDPKVIDQVRAMMPKTDLLFIDAAHRAKPTLLNALLYGLLFSPEVIVLDDITHNESMREAWTILQAIYRRQSVDCSIVVPAIRRREGFGLIALGKLKG
jgi:predicted O-methyltransferase YrrM